MRRMACRWDLAGIVLLGLLIAAGAVDGAEAVTAAKGSIFKPRQVPSLGALRVGKGAEVTFDTGSAKRAPKVSGAISGDGVLGHSAGGKVELALFAFDSVDLADGAKVTVKGDRGLVLLAGGKIVVNTTLDLSGGKGPKLNRELSKRWPELAREDGHKVSDGSDGPKDLRKEYQALALSLWNAGAGGPGGEGGEERKSLASNPPSRIGGNGGPGQKDNGVSGTGFGAGFNRRVKGGAAGSGGGYGGKGGDSSPASSGGANKKKGVRPMPGGASYGGEQLAELLGGSGGAGGSNDRQFESAAGGGGGGALALISDTGIVVGSTGKLLVNGGEGGSWSICGGGGSGGAVLLVAPSIDLRDGALIDAGGGDGGSNPDTKKEFESRSQPLPGTDLRRGRLNIGSGGGGGGGRVAFYSRDSFSEKPQAVNVSGGKGGMMAEDGGNGSFYAGRASFPNAPHTAAARPSSGSSESSVPSGKPPRSTVKKWEVPLLALIKHRVGQGEKPGFTLSARRQRMVVEGVTDDKQLRLSGGGSRLTWGCDRLSIDEKAAIAGQVANPGSPKEAAVAAFFYLAAGKERVGAQWLSRAGPYAPAVKRSLQQ